MTLSPFRARAALPAQPAHRFDPSADIEALRRGPDGLLVMAALLLAVFLSTVWLPSLGWASPPASSAETAAAVSTAKTSRLANPAVAETCAGQAWGEESMACVTAVAEASGRPLPRAVRIVRLAGAS